MADNNKKTIAILGATGMLGSMVYNVLKDDFNLVLVFRDAENLGSLQKAYGKTECHRIINFDFNLVWQDYLKGFKSASESPSYRKFIDELGPVDGMINCVGIILPHSLKDCANTLFINGALPHILAGTFREKLIHITTDCVYSGLSGFPYDENSLPSPNDLYGISKSIGDSTRCLTLRTSIIGPEITGFLSLLEWFKKQNGQTIKGFSNHFWNGVTTKEFGNICARIFANRDQYPENGIYHVFSTSVSKYDMLVKFREKYGINCEIAADDTAKLNRTLATVKDLNARLEIPSFDQMLKEL
jgi:dTDP-4-dehydrorhamnose reductase